jgi:hypothetical protein
MISSGHRSIYPHCIFSGYTFYQYNYGSAVYFMVAIPKKSLSLKHRYAYLGFETCHNICLMVVCIYFSSLSVSIPLLEKVYKVLQSSSSSDFALWGAICYTSKSLIAMMASVVVTNIASVAYWSQVSQTSYCLCHLSNDIVRTLRHLKD